MSTRPTRSTRITIKKDKNEEQFEVEQQFVLRMPPGEYARRLLKLIDSDDKNIRQRVFIDLNLEQRRDHLKFDDTLFKGYTLRFTIYNRNILNISSINFI
ncbi:unnamed protein product [Rotaria sp. Silwood2]|nr:unnamed protein product [Rotaria sp. Silwood2]CAF3115213.1 unnamed protein product [Rotaria sp. Silwood2]CAF3546610.1 unnamed protein product [Rotaria sp. Silwood2]CAF4424912.1 unnamed protein product [Rotaria sp. Silwood2]CAF4606370.1 unnamed protein product [Rotaria sp. Silwood2]